MIKKVFITFGILISIVLMFLISLSNGIRLGNFEFDSVNIQGLYLKYDKKLLVDTQSITVYNGDKTKETTFRIKFGIEPFFDKYFISVEQFLMFDPFLSISGDIILDLENIDLDKISQTYINQFSIQFHQNLKTVNADICYVTYKEDDFYFSFKNPSYAGILLDESQVKIEQYELLKLALRSKGIISGELLHLLSNYKINLPLTQLYGGNDTLVELDIPFDIKKDIKVYAEISVKNGMIELYEIPLYLKNIEVTLKDNKLFTKGKLQKTTKEHELQYDIDTDLIIDFSTDQATGDFKLNSGTFSELNSQKIKGDFFFDFKEEFEAAVKINSRSKLTVDEEIFFIDKANTKYTDKNKTFDTILILQHTK